MHEYRCDGCGKLIIKGILLKSYEEFKCGRCGKMVCFTGLANVEKPDRYFLLTDDKGMIVNASQSVKNNLGFSLDEIVGGGIKKLYSTEDEANLDKIFADKAIEFRHLRAESNHKTKSGEVVPIMICFRSLQKDGYNYVLRIADKKNIVDQEFEAQSTFNPENYSDFVGEVDLAGNVIYIDNCIKGILGFAAEEIIGRHLSEFLIPEEIPWRNKNMEILFARRQSYRIPSLKFIHKDGSIVDCECSSSPIYDDLGELIGYRDLCWIRR